MQLNLKEKRLQKEQAPKNPKISLQKQKLRKIFYNPTSLTNQQNLPDKSNPQHNLKPKSWLQPRTDPKLFQRKKTQPKKKNPEINIKLLVQPAKATPPLPQNKKPNKKKLQPNWHNKKETIHPP